MTRRLLEEGWTVFQKRQDGSVDFFRGWNDYKNGFGNLNGEFWLGLDKIHRLTKTRNSLRVDLEDTKEKTEYAEYAFFTVASERNKYNLSLGYYSGKTDASSIVFFFLCSALSFLSFHEVQISSLPFYLYFFHVFYMSSLLFFITFFFFMHQSIESSPPKFPVRAGDLTLL